MTNTAIQLEIAKLELGPIGTNCYILNQVGSNDAVIVDPGGDHDVVLGMLKERELNVAGILITHGHFDHIGGVAGIAETTDAKVWMSSIEVDTLEKPEQFARMGFPEVPAWQVTHQLEGNESIELGGITFEVIHVPGHSPGHLAFIIHNSDEPICLIGDVIFDGSIGRTDLPMSDPKVMDQTLLKLIRELDSNTVLLPGHGGITVMEKEIRTNPFLQHLRE